ncbi:hypothetical protein WJ0W_005527 [Paenibacillus melissococcoides]|uniref:Secreted protein n=1 Tax=Paenibacillus melissococcoides TaxID=2912268 RepID=A0ABM9GAP2_9BACL|nr:MULTISPECIES: hypothetical protein [Paenibacillus]MEB9892471.1 hypothetical protein [Bacillus cereus]CAH8248270.1 hypothetical protein WJ0W_005527 [Paenibacillus melissococcoides]CAH8717984.1 hypothetical protein HTL2_005124 [Paenibacillus melissococcoides]CAH8719137.1 hypothetical protein WDD9_005449 [Paenibacillus melissococcoides]
MIRQLLCLLQMQFRVFLPPYDVFDYGLVAGWSGISHDKQTGTHFAIQPLCVLDAGNQGFDKGRRALSVQQSLSRSGCRHPMIRRGDKTGMHF